MNNPAQLKGLVKNISKEKHISAQLVLQNYMLERLLERISLSEYRDNFILKGGFLIAAMVGLNSRATMDMDGTIKGYPVNEETIRDMFLKIIDISVDDDISFTFRSIGKIRENDEYDGYRVALTADYPPMHVPLKLDITTGDRITPKEIDYSFKLMFEDRSVKVLAYNLETIMAEKIETVISRGDQNTRPRDFYDIYILYKLMSENINQKILVEALKSTSDKRNSVFTMKNYKKIIDVVRNSDIMNKQWSNYQNDFEYAREVSFDEACNTVIEIMDKLNV